MNTYAWDAGLPCKNPNCHSYGKPHPNCKCYSNMKDGGEAHFCSTERMHDKDCEYFAEGGTLAPPDPKDMQSIEAPPPDPKNMQTLDQDIPNPKDMQEISPPKPEDLQPVNETAEEVKAGLMGAASAYTMGAATPAMEALGLHPKEAAENYPMSNLAGQAVGLGVGAEFGPAALIKGSMAVKQAVQMGALQFGDELSDYMAGNKHLTSLSDDAVAAMHILGAGGTAFVGTKALGAIGSQLGKAQNYIGQAISDFAAGIGASAEGEGLLPGPASSKAYERGYNFLSEILPKTENLLKSVASKGIGGYAGQKIGGEIGRSLYGDEGVYPGKLLGGEIGYRAADKAIGPIIDKFMPVLDNITRKTAIPIFLNAVQKVENGGFLGALDFGTRAVKGQTMLKNGVNNLFNLGGKQAFDYMASPEQIEKMKKYIDQGGINQQIDELKQPKQEMPFFAHGGEVKPAPLQQGNLGTLFPEQNILINAAKSRVSNYLQNLKPQEGGPKLAFDDYHKDPEKERDYHRALGLAVQPLSILKHIKDNKLLPEHMTHMNSMYPEVTDLLKKKVTEQITKQQIKKEKPAYDMRQSLSLFLGTPLDSTFTPGSIQAAQSVFSNQTMQKQQAAQPQAGGKTKKSTSKLGDVPKSFLTPDQAAESRLQRAH